MDEQRQVERMLARLDAGRTWSEIAEAEQLSVAAAKELVSAARRARREQLSERPEAQARLGRLCECGCRQHEHGDERGEHLGQCRVCGPERIRWEIRTEDGQSLELLERAPGSRESGLGCDRFSPLETKPQPAAALRYSGKDARKLALDRAVAVCPQCGRGRWERWRRGQTVPVGARRPATRWCPDPFHRWEPTRRR